MKTQYEKLARLLTRRKGVTAWEISQEVGTTCPHKRLADMKTRGWLITRREVPGQKSGRYFGVAHA